MDNDRRSFLSKLILALGGIAAGGSSCRLALRRPGQSGLGSQSAEAATQTNLVWITGQDPYANTVKAVNALGGMKRFVKKGHRVTILPNIGWARKPEQAANTNPQVVRALIEMCHDVGAKSITIFCNPCNDMRVCLDLSGIGKIVEGSAARFEYISGDGWRARSAPTGCTHIKSADVYRAAIECDTLISAPIAKHHGGSTLTMCCKNLMGAVRDRGYIHQALHPGIADLAMMIPTSLCVLDATRILLRNGPTGGDVKDTQQMNTVIAGLNPGEVDVLGATLFQMAPSEIKYLKILADRGFMNLDPSKLGIKRLTA